MVSVKACSLIAKDLGLSLESLSKALKGKLPRGVAAYDRVVVAGEKAGNAFQTEILTFKNSNGEMLKRTINKVGDEGTNFTVRNYQKTNQGKFIHTNNFVNNKLVGTKQETIALTKYTNANVVTRTYVSKEFTSYGSFDKHSIGEYVDQGRSGRQVVNYFDRDKNGLLMRIPQDEFASIYLNTNKSEVARDLTQIYSRRFGFDEMPKVETFQGGKNNIAAYKDAEGKVNRGFHRSLNIKDHKPELIMSEIGILTRQPKHLMVNAAAHENWHMRQFGKCLEVDDLTHAKNSEAKVWWQKYLDKNPKPQPNSRYAKKVEQYQEAFGNPDCGNRTYDEYRKDILEIEAFKKGGKAQKEYMSRLKHPRTGLVSKFNGADWERLHA